MNVKSLKNSKFFYLMLLLTTVLSPLVIANTSVHAAESSENRDALFNYDINKLDQYVQLDKDSLTYLVSSDAKNNLSESELIFLENKVRETNAAIAKISIDSSKETLTVSDKTINISQSISKNNSLLRYREGRNDIRWYWWGARIWISRSTLNYLGNGLAIGGIWLPEPVISKILATVGVVIGSCPGGIVVNSSPGVPLWGLEWQ